MLFCFVLFVCFFFTFSRFSTPEPNAQVHQYNLALSVVINFSHFRLLLSNGIQRILTGSKISTSSTKFVLIGPLKKNKMSALASDWLRHFRLLLRNHWMEFNETWKEARSQRPLPSLWFSGRSERQDGHPGLWLTETFSTSPLWPLIGIQRNLKGSKI